MNSPGPPISIVLADDHPVVLHGMASILRLKDIAPESLADCVRQVASGGQWFPADVVDAAMEREMGRRVQSKQLVQTLTPRERQVVVSLCEGNSNKRIARQLNLTEGTVKVHLSNIYNKLGVANRTALTALTIVHRDQLDSGISDVFDADWKASDASIGASDPTSE